MEEASSIDSSHTFSLSKLFDKEEILNMRDLMKEMCEEQLMAMKKEKDQLLERLHEMEIQLHEANDLSGFFEMTYG